MEDLRLKWEKTGLLQGINNEDNEKLLSSYFEEGIKLLDKSDIKSISPFDDDKVVAWFMPILRRIFNNMENLDVVDIHNELNKFIGSPEIIKLSRDLPFGIDLEAELVVYFCEKYVNSKK